MTATEMCDARIVALRCILAELANIADQDARLRPEMESVIEKLNKESGMMLARLAVPVWNELSEESREKCEAAECSAPKY